jgi:MFS family permease
MRFRLEMPENANQTDAYKSQVGTKYSWHVLGILFVVYALNFIDRQILGILAPQIAIDLKLSLANLGFLYGTAFAVFYALFGIPLGKLADMWVRTRLMAIGLGFWSLMTAASGFASSLTQLTLARMGVGIGEATASPCAYSMISDYFPKAKRATALAIYGSGLFFGAGLSLFLGGTIADGWSNYFPNGTAPFGLKGWQAAFVIVGLPGLILAWIVASLKEPVRGLADGLPTPAAQNPWPAFFDELMSIIPPFTLLHLIKHKATTATLLFNLLGAACVVGAGYVLFKLTQDWKQWTALGIGVYAVFSWAQSIKIRDRASFAMIWGSPTFILVVVCAGLISFTGYVFGYFSVQYAMPYFAMDAETAGLMVGLPGALAAATGATFGGIGADWMHQKHPAGRLIWVLIVSTIALPCAFLAFHAESIVGFLSALYMLNFFGAMWLGGCAATMQELVLPRMRGVAAATFFVGTTMIGLALGPYFAGMIADMQIPSAIKASGAVPPAMLAKALRIGILSSFVVSPVVILLLVIAIRKLPQAIASKTDRARTAGEVI